jgi:hypothetical protein
VIVFEGDVGIAENQDYFVEKRDGFTKIKSKKHAKVDDQLVLELEMSLKN